MTKNGNDIAVIIETASLVVAAAGTLIEKGKPIIEEVDAEAAAEKAKAAAVGVAKGAKAAAGGIGKGASAVKKGAAGAAGVFGATFGKLGDTRDEVVKALSDARSEKELRKAIQAARQTVLENATVTMTIKDFIASRDAAEKAGEAIEAAASIGAIDMPGCFIIATYKKFDFDKDLTDYIGIYVGKADDVASGISEAISREGDPDVYADVKYKQNVHVYAYNCLPEDLEARYAALYQTFEPGEAHGVDEEVGEGE